MVSRILVVDDSSVDRSLVAGLLRNNPNYDIELAENGREALELVDTAAPDLVVTDLVMPEIDGLELVRLMRRRYPQIPVILMTAFGNESVAVEALQAGAAHYVPKARQAERLLETVERVLDRAVSDQRRERLVHCVLEHQTRFVLDNDPALIRALADQVQEMMASVHFADVGERIRVVEALEEALLNAMYHGNLEISERELATARAELDGGRLTALVKERRSQPRFRDRKILVVASVSETQVKFVIRDEGRGFSVRSVTGADPASSFDGGKRRGLTLIQIVMDDVTFNESGNEMTMRKRCERQSKMEPSTSP